MDYAKHLAAHTLQGGLNVDPTESIPAAMHGAPNSNAPVWAQDDWREWHTVASPLTATDIEAFEQQFAVALPQQFRQYLMACCHIFSEMPAASFAESIYIANTPSNAPLTPLTHIINSAARLLDAGYLPIGDWGLGYGPSVLMWANAAHNWTMSNFSSASHSHHWRSLYTARLWHALLIPTPHQQLNNSRS
ncbi:SMI1/KNR4 family protein [Shewanella sp. C32]|uniref:SMI1/KNR4 family protein n=1 Tax=Shewanella electrica TaxID=515560 RepID=A0ABT2FFR0_9GAMM|nr:SMI1/KNR4 family protein [Shewanella electrica]MCH1925308.1 SMI1/KNR4 family protein [Shewanella electrica]MCS4555133.1 SMI1/KNR4 family protein [Shewanella electrica]